MSKFIRVTKIRSDRTETASATMQPSGSDDQFTNTDEPGENLVGGGRTVAEVDAANAELLKTEHCIINVDAIRCFYPRVDGRPGTRITFNDGNGFAVTEDFETVATLAMDGQPVG